MSKFLAGQIVKLKEYTLPFKYQNQTDFGNRSCVLQNSVHVLAVKDIKRGYYFTNIGSFDLKDCMAVSEELQYYKWCTSFSGYDQSLIGAVTKPVPLERYQRIAYEYDSESITTHIFIKSTLTRVTGRMYDMCLYWIGLNNDIYRTKLKTTKEGYVVGRNVLIGQLSDKKLKQCYKLGE